ncbi:MAG: hypothetical protein HY863_21965, partial [Chloroflexi bacterium]|nr:hypothetical protein [Chloroflexota bacterium]
MKIGISQSNNVNLIRSKGEKMKTIKVSAMLSVIFILSLVMSACSALATEPAPTNTPQPTATLTLVPTKTLVPTVTPLPTRTPNYTATQRAEEYNAETQKYFDLGYLTTKDGTVKKIDDFYYEWAQLGWYNWIPLETEATDFYISAHFAWDSAFKNADLSGCGFAFAIQEDREHYAVFLDRAKVVFLDADNRFQGSRFVGTTRGTNMVNFTMPGEADFSLIVKG